MENLSNKTAGLKSFRLESFGGRGADTQEGAAMGSATAGSFFGIIAPLVGELSINGAAISLPPGNPPLDFDAANHNFQLVRF